MNQRLNVVAPRYRSTSSTLVSKIGAAVLASLLAFSVYRENPGLAGVFLIGLMVGVTIQKSRFCFVACFRDPLLTGDTTLSRALVLSLGLATLGFSLAAHYWDPSLKLVTHPMGLHTLIGGVLFGVGMVLAGCCASGALVRTGEGSVAQFFALSGLVLGATWAASHLGWWHQVAIKGSPVITLHKLYGWPAGLMVQLTALALVYYLLLVLEARNFGYQGLRPHAQPFKMQLPRKPLAEILESPWSYEIGAVLLALLSVFSFLYQGRPWSITTGLAFWGARVLAYLEGAPQDWLFFANRQEVLAINLLAEPRTVMNIAIICGALLASALASELRLRKTRSYKYALAAFAGGMMMGYGARIASGCNIGALYNGIASTSLHGWAFAFFVLVGAYAGTRILIRLFLRAQS